jgi:magnesium-transporting ATPase (P-type)
MWQIIKAELIYHKIVLIFGSITVLLFANAAKFGFEEFDLSEWAWMVFLAAYAVIQLLTQKEKREHYFARLPLPIKTIGLARISLLYLIFFGLLLLGFPDEMAWENLTRDLRAWTILLGNTLLLIAYALSLIVVDLNAIGNRKYRRIFWASIAGYALLMTTLVTVSVAYDDKENIPDLVALLLQKPILPILLSLLPIPILFYLSVAVFERRKSYMTSKC